MIQHNIAHDFKVLNFVDDPSAAKELESQTPINKIPVLFDGGQKIYDSRVIIRHLGEKHGWKNLSLDEENLVSMIYGVLDSAVILFLLRKDGFDIESDGFFLSRQRKRIPDSLNAVTEWANALDPKKEGDWNYPSMALFSALYWGEAREIFKMSEFPKLKNFYERFKNHPGVQETSF